MSDHHDGLGKFFVLAICITALVAFVAMNCGGSADTVRETLRKHGFTDVQVGGYAPFSCGEGDWSSTSFCARNPKGDRVCGVVCCGLLKHCTVRF